MSSYQVQVFRQCYKKWPNKPRAGLFDLRHQ